MDTVFAVALLVLVFAGVLLAAAYIWVLTRFFAELRTREPDVWHSIGSPTLLNMLFWPFGNFRRYYAFRPVLKARRNDARYHYSNQAGMLLKAGLCYVLLLFALAGVQAVLVNTQH